MKKRAPRCQSTLSSDQPHSTAVTEPASDSRAPNANTVSRTVQLDGFENSQKFALAGIPPYSRHEQPLAKPTSCFRPTGWELEPCLPTDPALRSRIRAPAARSSKGEGKEEVHAIHTGSDADVLFRLLFFLPDFAGQLHAAHIALAPCSRPHDHLAHGAALGQRLQRLRDFRQRIGMVDMAGELAVGRESRELDDASRDTPCGSRRTQSPK